MSAHDLLTTRDCAAWSCTDSATGEDGLCDRHSNARKTRADLVREYMALLDEGFTREQIADRYGKSYSAVTNLLADPDGSKQRARRKRYQGRCEDCGAATDGSNGHAGAPTLCEPCSRVHQHDERYWTPAQIVAAIREWAAIHDAPPVSTTWLRGVELDAQGRRRWPPVNVVQREFGTWAAAIAAAGFARPRIGGYRRSEETRAKMSASRKRSASEKFEHARDYGAKALFTFQLPTDQRAALDALAGPSVAEHLRRAVDLYLAALDVPLGACQEALSAAEGEVAAA